MRRILGLTVLTLVAGCTNPNAPKVAEPRGTEAASPGAGGVQQVLVAGNDELMFAPTVLTARPGPLLVTFRNDGNTPHTFRVKGVEPDTGNVDGHASATITVELTHPGTYTFQCDYHPGMVGVIHVSG